MDKFYSDEEDSTKVWSLVGMACAISMCMIAGPAAMSQLYGYKKNQIDRELDRVVAADATSWKFYSFQPGSMEDSSIIARSSDGKTEVWRGYFLYGSGEEEEVRIRVRGNRVDCVSYDVFYHSWCDLYGGGSNAVAWAVVGGLTLVAAAGASSGSSQGGSSSYNPEADRQACFRRCESVGASIEDHNVGASAANDCRKRC
jgi:hypothetical protein